MTVVWILVGWWAFLVFVAWAICRIGDKPLPSPEGWRNDHA